MTALKSCCSQGAVRQSHFSLHLQRCSCSICRRSTCSAHTCPGLCVESFKFKAVRKYVLPICLACFRHLWTALHLDESQMYIVIMMYKSAYRTRVGTLDCAAGGKGTFYWEHLATGAGNYVHGLLKLFELMLMRRMPSLKISWISANRMCLFETRLVIE